MPRHLVGGNGKFLINLDRHSFIRDLHYPYVGQLNRAGGYRCRVRIRIDGPFSRLSDPEWKFRLNEIKLFPYI